MPLQNLSCFYVMAEAAIAQTTTFLRRIYRNWQLKSVLKLEEHRYPPYTSKFNPIEHRLFPHVTRACQGAVFTSIELVKSLIEKTSTKTGLSVVVNLMDKVYAKGREVADGFKENLPIIFDEYLPKWNYRAIPQNN